MSDTFTTNLVLTKPEVGDSADTWGTKLNTNFDSIAGLFAAGPALKVENGGTGGTTAATARVGLGLGTLATQNSDAVAITGGTAVLTGGVALTASSTAPRISLYATGAGANEKRWVLEGGNGNFGLYAINDAYDGATPTALYVTRTGTTISSVAISGTSVTINGSVAYHAGNISSATIAETQITDGAVLARVGGNETVTGTWNFTSIPQKTGGGKFLHYASSTYSGGAVTVSTDNPSGTPAAGDRWVKYVV